ncbi:ABC-3 protein [Acidothermus cellulolyticus 11B]|uniref:ABC-3 protein n=1 Tax=Acidothermus cellulolyticus (strain ATCC 43068 / DSM 8971 / 11B) TaxID=351607 RepID=A0LWQ1_ACIC1|nr:metal ABC transporter permease [Acidothermus cellulolyticus]ABK53861.1 ABC-3 protein [Acidothermus cellulolyticus 11B]
MNIAAFVTTSYLQHALIAGSAAAITAGVIGYFLVLRAQVFTADAFGHITYVGALGALVAGVNPLAGIFLAVSITAGLLAVAGGPRGGADDVTIGATFSWALGLGALFAAIYTTRVTGAHDGRASISYLFGTVLSLTTTQVVISGVVLAIVVGTLWVVGRPLLFATVDPRLAAGRGVPVRWLDAGFLLLVGLTVGQAAQTMGALLILGLLAAPAGAAHLLTPRPIAGMLLAALLALLAVWSGLFVAYALPDVPPSFAILATAAFEFACAGAPRVRRLISRRALVHSAG